ncbi:hypothetical protein AnigIFM60653_001154 [Aspergillus niger]|nr:hypothetical protein AnigIFM60653_001154 [Aspergillus niger]
MASNPNPGNFANRPHEEVENIARKGGQSSHSGGFASMDEDKQPGDERAREAGHKGGISSGGSFEPGDPRAREAGRKGGSRTGEDMPEE